VGDKDPLAAKLAAIATELQDARKRIVATKEGGAITGEERIREHLDQLYGALTRWEGRPAAYQVERIDALTRELADVKKDVDTAFDRDIKPLRAELETRHLEPIPTTFAQSDEDDLPSGEVTTAAIRCLMTRGEACDDAAAAARRWQAEHTGERD
jgi:hypothetical protein